MELGLERGEAKLAPRVDVRAGEPACETCEWECDMPRERAGRRGTAKLAREAGRRAEEEAVGRL